jgi:hypothetical protein
MMEHMDRIFWKRFGDEYYSEPQSPRWAWFGGIFNVALVFFFLFGGLLTPVFRLAIVATNLVTGADAFSISHKQFWSKTIIACAWAAACIVVVRRYWRYHVNPEASLPYRESINRLEMLGMSIGYLVGAMAVMAAFMWLFWLTPGRNV